MKSIFASKTFWFNVITGILGIASGLNADTLNQLGASPTTTTKVLFSLGVLVAIGNIFLRSITSMPVSMTIGKQ